MRDGRELGKWILPALLLPFLLRTVSEILKGNWDFDYKYKFQCSLWHVRIFDRDSCLGFLVGWAGWWTTDDICCNFDS